MKGVVSIPDMKRLSLIHIYSAGLQNNTELSENLKDADFNLRETEAIDFEALSAYGLPIIIDYGADSCIPCKQMAPVLEKANKEFYGKAFVKFINVWDLSLIHI